MTHFQRRRFVSIVAPCLVVAVAVGEGCSASGPTTPSVTAVPPAVAGTYRLTFTASDTCVPDQTYNGTLDVPATLPAEARSRTYFATVTQDGAHLHVDLSGGDFVTVPLSFSESGHSFKGEIPYNSVVFRDAVSLAINRDDEEVLQQDLLERIAPTMYLGISGNALGTITSSTIEGTLDGTFWVYGGSGNFYTSDSMSHLPLIGVCKSPAHRFVFERMSMTQLRHLS